MGLLYVVEDSPAQRELLRAALAPLGHEVRTFADGQTARAAIKDTGRALGIPLPRVNQITEMVPEELKITIKKALEKNGDAIAQKLGDLGSI